MSNNSYAVGVDVGGTFTDIFLLNQSTGEVEIAKTPSTLQDQSIGLVEGIASRLGDFSKIQSIIHGTTTGTNALLERKGAKCGIITSKGFKDVLEMRRRDRPQTWGLWGQYEPVVRRDHRLEVSERTHADGTIIEAIDPNEVQKQAKYLLDHGCLSVCIFFINSYANDENERAAYDAIKQIWPNDYVTRATQILPEIREFERLSTATLNAYLQPVVSSYMDRLDEGLSTSDFNGDLLIVQSNGGMMSVDSAKSYPVRTALSGPAAGVRAAQAISRSAGFENIITCDLGGTSFDVSLIANGEAALDAQTEIDFGMVVRTPMIKITTIGAGGGSIARIDAGGLLQVGPQSAGSNPGPVSYGLGNSEPTLTDANLVLGRINAERPIGGKLDRLDVEAARQAIKTKIADPLQLNIENAAEAILKIANAKMAGAIRLVSIERGHDPALFYAMPFGGGGALHTGALVHECGLKGALVPRYPGVTSALGCVVADMRHDHVKTVNCLLDDVDAATLGQNMMKVAEGLDALLAKSGVAFSKQEKIFELDMLYLGQTHTVSVPISLNKSVLQKADIQQAFDVAYKENFGRLLGKNPTRIMNYKVAVIGRRPKFDMRVFAPQNGKSTSQCVTDQRKVFVNGEWQDVLIYDRLNLSVGAKVVGPCILEQTDTTIFVDPGLGARVDEFGNLIIERLG